MIKPQRIAEHEAGHALHSISLDGTTHVELMCAASFWEVRRHPLPPPTAESVYDMLTAGYVAEAFIEAWGKVDVALDLLNSADDPLEWARFNSPISEFDLEPLAFMDRNEIRRSHQRNVELIGRDGGHYLKRLAVHIHDHCLPRMKPGQCEVIWVAREHEHLDVEGLKRLAAGQIPAA